MTAADADVLVKRMQMMLFADPVGEGRAYNLAITTCVSFVQEMVDAAQSTAEAGTCEYRRSSAMCRRPDGSWRETPAGEYRA